MLHMHLGGCGNTINNGTTFNPIMDNSITQNIGDFDVDWSSKTILCWYWGK